MNKAEFIGILEEKLKRLPAAERAEAVEYYSEIIDDKMAQEGIGEEKAVASLGDPARAARLAGADAVTNGGRRNLMQIFAFCGILLSSPVLIPLAIVGLLCYLLFFVCVITVIALFAGLAVGSVLFAYSSLFTGSLPAILVALGIGLVGLTVFSALTYISAKNGFILMNRITVGLFRKLVKGRNNK